MPSESSTSISFAKGQVIFREGQPSSVAYMIEKGAVHICRSIDDKKVILTRLQAGEIFGEMGVIASMPRTADAEAAEACELRVLTHSLVAGLLAKCPRTIRMLTGFLIRRLKKPATWSRARPTIPPSCP